MMTEQRLQEIEASAEDHTTELIVALRQAWLDRHCAESERNEWQTKYGNEHCRDCCCARLWRVLQNPLGDEAGHDGLVGAVWELRKERDEIARTHALMSDGLVQCMSEREHWRTRAEQAESIAGDAKTQNERLVAALTEARRVLRAQDECMVCKAELFRDLTVPHCFDCVVDDDHAEEWDAICAAKAAVLAQDTDA